MTTSDPLRPRLLAALENWKRKLLDLTKRNRLLHFKVTKVSTLAVVDELPTEVFRRLYLKDLPMKFRATETSDGTSTDPAEEADIEEGLDEEYQAPAPAADYSPYEPGTAADRHTDEWLQTALDRESLDRSLRRIDEQSRSTIEEQGVNTLFLTLGMLRYTESSDSDEAFRAPLIMLPVELSRSSARAGFQLRAADDEPMVNPALIEHMRSLGVRVPTLPDSETITDDYDLQDFLKALQDEVSAKKGWSVQRDIYLGLFSFQKFVMFKDLETHAASIAAHRLSRQLVGKTGTEPVGLPPEIRSLDLDAEHTPETTAQVVDADSSQLRSIAACARGYDLVIEGPPGTGKSQTITNLIAQALWDGKAVLFVAEKMAALSVVHGRLKTAGLGEFCLELHSSKSNKRQVMQELRSALDASLTPIATAHEAVERLPVVRKTLSDYVSALHEPFGVLGLSPYKGFGEFGTVRHAPTVALNVPIDTIDRPTLAETIRGLEDLASITASIGTPKDHPWRDSSRALLTEPDLETIAEHASSLTEATRTFSSLASEAEVSFGLPSIQTLEDAKTALEIGAVLTSSPGAAVSVLQSEAWNAPPASAVQLIEDGRTAARLSTRIRTWFKPDVLDRPHSDDIAFVEARLGRGLSFLAILNGGYRAIRREWREHRLTGYSKSMIEQASDLKLVDQLSAMRQHLRSVAAEAEQLFGALWQGEHSDWELLSRYIEWVVSFRRICVGAGVQAKAYEVASRPSANARAFDGLRSAADEVARHLAAFRDVLGWPSDYLQDAPIAEIAARARAIHEHLDLGPGWAAFERARQVVAGGRAADMLPPVLDGRLSPADLSAAFRKAFYGRWLTLAVRDREPLARFAALTHEQRVREFRALDRSILKENQGRLIDQLREATQDRLRSPEAQRSLPVLKTQMARQRNIRPLRAIMKDAAPAVRAIKPCFMMSPMTVAQMLDGSAPQFDLVIFDEASQLPTEDAIGAVIRGRQLVVVGDPKQLPPTNFFSVTTGQIAPSRDAEGNLLLDDSESILEEFMGSGVPTARLKWHYRSTHESLITFSNATFYDSDLYTFPSIDADTLHHGLQFEFVEGGRYEGSGLNLVEARRVADEVIRFARRELERERGGEEALSLGVGTFNLRQQIAIQDELERRRRAEPSIEAFFDRSREDPFFVKNLENIQGDERDVIFISVTYGPGPDGRIRYNFGPLNQQNGGRRLNVLVTRARQLMRVFASMRGQDVNPTGATSTGPVLLRDFLNFAEHKRLDGLTVTSSAATESPFEREVLAELANRGFLVIPQVGQSGYRIDLGVLDPDHPGRFICGIECDGVAYHASETARDRDRLRQEVLEERGWIIHRVWSTDWFKDRKGQVERLARAVEEARAQAGQPDRTSRSEVSIVAVGPEEMDDEQPPVIMRSIEAHSGALPTYRRPVASHYAIVDSLNNRPVGDILSAPISELTSAVRRIVEIESPIHAEDLYARVASLWDTKLGSRVRHQVVRAVEAAVRAKFAEKRGDFFWTLGMADCGFRSRELLQARAERIAPEEYRAAIMAILQTGHRFSRAKLIGEVRAVLGFSRTGHLLEAAIGAVVDTLLADGLLGEGSDGLALRVAGETPASPHTIALPERLFGRDGRPSELA